MKFPIIVCCTIYHSRLLLVFYLCSSPLKLAEAVLEKYSWLSNLIRRSSNTDILERKHNKQLSYWPVIDQSFPSQAGFSKAWKQSQEEEQKSSLFTHHLNYILFLFIMGLLLMAPKSNRQPQLSNPWAQILTASVNIVQLTISKQTAQLLSCLS